MKKLQDLEKSHLDFLKITDNKNPKELLEWKKQN